MPDDACAAKRAWWPGDFASATGGSSAPADDDCPDLYFLLIDGGLGGPNFCFAEIDKYWDRLHSRASTPPIAGTNLEAFRELASPKSPGRAKMSARVSPPRWGGRTIGRHTVSFCFLGSAARSYGPALCSEKAFVKWDKPSILCLDF